MSWLRFECAFLLSLLVRGVRRTLYQFAGWLKHSTLQRHFANKFGESAEARFGCVPKATHKVCADHFDLDLLDWGRSTSLRFPESYDGPVRLKSGGPAASPSLTRSTVRILARDKDLVNEVHNEAQGA